MSVPTAILVTKVEGYTSRRERHEDVRTLACADNRLFCPVSLTFIR